MLKWIFEDNYNLKNIKPMPAIPEKDIIMAYFKKHSEPKACASSNVFDNIKKKETDIRSVSYSDGVFDWTSSHVYHFEKYNVKLSDEFIQHVLDNS